MVKTKPKLKGPPPDMEVPEEISLKRSGVNPDRIGIWCRSHIPCGKKFGPFMGNRVQMTTSNMDPAYVWEIVDLKTKEFLFYIDATDERHGNWMRYINCARYFEEQNIVSEQEGVDIIYRAIKDIYPEEEILTWYEKTPFRRKKGRKTKKSEKVDGDEEVTQPASMVHGSKARTKSTDIEANQSENDKPGTSMDQRAITSLATSRETCASPADIQPDISERGRADTPSDMHISQRGRRCKVTKYWEMEADFSNEEEDEVVRNPRITVQQTKTEVNLQADKPCIETDEEWSVDASTKVTAKSTVSQVDVANSVAFYQFDVQPCHVVKNGIGRKLYQCDVCSSVYRHSFSLKRHFIRNHLNYKYVSQTDLMNCCIPVKTAPHAADSMTDNKLTDGNGGIPTETISTDHDGGDSDKKEDREGKMSLTSSLSLDSMTSVIKDSETFIKDRDGANTSLSVADNSDLDTSDKDEGQNDDCYGDDTEEYLDSDSESESFLCSKKDSISIMEKGDVCEKSDARLGEGPMTDVLKDAKERVTGNSTAEETNTDEDVTTEQMTLKSSSDCGRPEPASTPPDITNTVGFDSPQLSQSPSLVKSHSVDSISKASDTTAVDACDTQSDKSSETYCVTNKMEDSSTFPDVEMPVLELEVEENTKKGNVDVESSDEEKRLKVVDGIPVNIGGEKIYGLYRCNMCADLYDTVQQLKSHLANHPEAADGRKTFACEKCEMKFAHKQNLMRHQAVHTGTRPYVCSYCDKKFPTSTNLRRHEKVHQGRKFTCPHCTSTFTQTGDLKQHVNKVHPELFNECAFCPRYFIKQRLLSDHLLEMHSGKTLEDNDDEITSRQEAFRLDLHIDRTESMRLAIIYGKKKPGPKFACTVCRKRFHDYSNMCRHRRLAHQRPIFVPPIRDENGDIIDDAASQCSTQFQRGFYDPEDKAQSAFYSNIANSIADNLHNYIEGKEEHLQKVEMVVKWKNPYTAGSIPESNNKAGKVFADSVVHNLQEFNFPKDFKLKSSGSNYRSVPYSSDGRISWKNKKAMAERRRTESMNGDEAKDTAVPQSPAASINPPSSSALLQFLQNDIPRSSIPHSMTSTSLLASAELAVSKHNGLLPPPPPLLRKPKSDMSNDSIVPSDDEKDLLIRVPQVKTCKMCRCLFHNHEVYFRHMEEKHGVIAEPKLIINSHLPENEDALDQPKPAHSNYAITSPPLTDAPGSKWRSFPQPGLTVKPEPTWNQMQLIDSERNLPTETLQQAAASENLTDTEMLPLDLSKSSHFAGYKLTNRKGNAEYDAQATEIENPQQLLVEVKVEEKVSEPKFICLACYSQFDTYDDLSAHQEHDHPNVKCAYTQLNDEVARHWKINPNPIGVLNVCSTQLPPVTASPKRTNKLTCTKCSKKFQCMVDLHNHIDLCAEPYQPKLMFVYYYPGTKNRHFFLPGQKGEMVKVEKGQKFRRNGLETPHKKKAPLTNMTLGDNVQKQLIPDETEKMNWNKNGDDALFDDDQLINGKKRRRRNYELLYNPHKHIRRREMAEVIDTPKCSGCNGLFSTISLLERHIPMCRNKDKIQDAAMPKETVVVQELSASDSDEDAYDPKKHMCIYCQKQFTYFGMLRKHVFDVCNVRRDLVEKGEYIDDEWEKDISSRAGQSQPRTLSRQSSVSSFNGIDLLDTNDNSMDSKMVKNSMRGRRRRRGNGWYKGKGNMYKKKESNAGWEWERYFVLDETFMGVYNSVEGADDEEEITYNPKHVSGMYDERSNHSHSASSHSLSFENSHDGSTNSKKENHRESLEKMQTQKRALFAELTKPIEERKPVVDDSSTTQAVTPAKPKPKKVQKSEKNVQDKRVAKTKNGSVKESSKNESPNKVQGNRITANEYLASVKQKLAKKIIENKKRNQAALKKNKSPARPQKPVQVETLKTSVKIEKSTAKVKNTNVKLSQAKANKSISANVPVKKLTREKSITKALSKTPKKMPAKVMPKTPPKAKAAKTKQNSTSADKTHKAIECNDVLKESSSIKHPLGQVPAIDDDPVDGYANLCEIVAKYHKSVMPNMWLGRPPKKVREMQEENFVSHISVDEVINEVVKASGADESVNTIVLEDSSEDEEDNMKLSQLRKTSMLSNDKPSSSVEVSQGYFKQETHEIVKYGEKQMKTVNTGKITEGALKLVSISPPDGISKKTTKNVSKSTQQIRLCTNTHNKISKIKKSFMVNRKLNSNNKSGHERAKSDPVTIDTYNNISPRKRAKSFSSKDIENSKVKKAKLIPLSSGKLCGKNTPESTDVRNLEERLDSS